MACLIWDSMGCGFESRKAFAVRITPGVQKPHCTAPSSMKACCRGWSLPCWDNPSIVVISLSSTSPTKTRQELIALPSRRTVQEPQFPVPQPSLVPVNLSSYRRTSRSMRSGSTVISYSRPFTFIFMGLYSLNLNSNARLQARVLR